MQPEMLNQWVNRGNTINLTLADHGHIQDVTFLGADISGVLVRAYNPALDKMVFSLYTWNQISAVHWYGVAA